MPTISDNLERQHKIRRDIYSIYFDPIDKTPVSNGRLTFGGIDSSDIRGDVTFVDITSSYPASRFWGVDASVSYGSHCLLSGNAGIVDSGTTLTLLASDKFADYIYETGAQYDSYNQMYYISQDQFAGLSNLDFNIGSRTYTMIPDAQIWPRRLNYLINGDANRIYLAIGSVSSNSLGQILRQGSNPLYLRPAKRLLLPTLWTLSSDTPSSRGSILSMMQTTPAMLALRRLATLTRSSTRTTPKMCLHALVNHHIRSSFLTYA